MKKHRLLFLAFCAALLLSAAALGAAEVTRIGGHWNFNGTGSINGISVTDSGMAEITTYVRPDNLEVATSFYVQGVLRTEYGAEESYSHRYGDPNSGDGLLVNPEIGGGTRTYDGITLTLTIVNEDKIRFSQVGRQYSTGYRYDMIYEATRDSGDGGGGGCSVGFAPSMLLLTLPLIYLARR
ncbi:MAG: SYNERG-CTERM sorting domain-containing protein [Synergistales bacterium]|nr:SYNERG-CTERM sorting domain-containing protein [Synergistales bacterium]